MKIREFFSESNNIFQKLSETEELFEINMSPSSLRKLAASIDARAGVEFEMIVPNTQSDDEDGSGEPDYDQDERSRSWSDIEDFFLGGDGANGRRDVERALERLQEEFYEYADERILEDFLDDQYNIVKEWVVNNVSDEDIMDAGYYEEDDRAKFEDDAEFRKKVIKDYVDNAIENQTSDWESAREEYRDDVFGDFEEGNWLQRNYPYMSDVENNFDLNWPYYTYGGDGEANIGEVADSFKSKIGKPVEYSTGYHSIKRNDTDYIIEPDSSLAPDDGNDAGLEFISPPMPVDEMFADMDKIVNWANNYGCYTNSSTGLHMNISVPGMSKEKLDYVKLAILMGDEYILEKFGRSANGYAKSAMKIVRERIQDRPEDAKRMLEQMKQHLAEMATKVIHSGETSKYTSINTKDGYIEFRSPGGDWLTEYNENKNKIESTMLRFVVAMEAALDPEKYRQEYLKKLYKLLSPKSETDTLSYFAKYVAGELPQSALKSFIKQAQLERNLKKGNTGGQDFKWEVGRPGYGASIIVVAKSKEEAIDKALAPDGYPDWANARNQLTAKPIGPADTSPAKATVNEPRPAGEAGSVKYELFNRGSDIVIRTFWARDDEMAIEIGNRYRQEAMAEFDMERSSIGMRRARQQPTAQQQSQPVGGEFTGTWLVKDANDREIHRFSGIGNNQGDANRHAMEWLRRNPEQMRDGVTVVPEMR